MVVLYYYAFSKFKDAIMAQPDSRNANLTMDPASVYREELYSDRKIGTIRCLVPVKSDGTPDPSRKPAYVGEAQIMTPMGALPVTFEIDAPSLSEAIAQYGPAAKEAVERTVKELQELRRQASSSIVVPQGGIPPGALGGGGKIQLP
jgi:hypothetical protein